MKEKLAHFKKWGELIPIYTETMKHGEYSFGNRDHITPFGRKLLKFIWCYYERIEVELQWTNFRSYQPENIYYCVPGTLPMLFYYKWRNNDNSKVSVSKAD